MAGKISAVKLLDAVTSTQTGVSHHPWRHECTYQLIGKTTSGSGSAVCIVEVSNDGVTFVTMGTITLTLSSSNTSDGFVQNASWRYVRGRLTTLTGTGANVTLWMGGYG